MEADDLNEALGAHLLHASSSIYLNVRGLEPRAASSDETLERHFERYADLSWPGAHRAVTSWTAGALVGLTSVLTGAMPESIVREWFVTDGTAIANAAAFATARQWEALLPDCDALVRSIRFEASSSCSQPASP